MAEAPIVAGDEPPEPRPSVGEGCLMGALLLAVLDSGTVMMSVSSDWRRAFVGAVILVAVLVDLLRPRRA